MDPILIISSLLFVVPITYAAHHRYWYIYLSFLFMLVTSVAFHSSKNSFILKLDLVAIVNIILLSLVTAYYINCLPLFIVGSSWILFIYIYGYMNKTMAFSPSYVESRLYHSTIHMIIGLTWVWGISNIHDTGVIHHTHPIAFLLTNPFDLLLK